MTLNNTVVAVEGEYETASWAQWCSGKVSDSQPCGFDTHPVFYKQL